MPPRPGDSLSFTPDRALLNPKFESYKLAVPTSRNERNCFPLPNQGVSLRALPDKARLSFSEVQARVRHNHLSVGFEGEAVYVDGELGMVVVTLDEAGTTPAFHRVLELASPISVESPTSPVPEYPTALAVSSHLWVVSDGAGRLYLVQVDPSTWTAAVEATYELELEDRAVDLTPFRLHSVDTLEGGRVVALISTTEKIVQQGSGSFGSRSATGGAMASGTRLKIPSSTVFDLILVDVSLHSIRKDREGDVEMEEEVKPIRMEPIWTYRAHDLPSYVSFDKEAKRYIVGGPTALYDFQQEPSPHFDPLSAARPAPVGESPQLTIVEPSIPRSNQPKPPPFSWTQDSESVTVVFAVPSDTPTSSIRVTFSRLFLTLHIGSAQAALLSPSSISSDVPHISHKKLWDEVDPHSSVWTFDREAEGRDSTFGLLTLHLEKGNAGTRWSDVFASTASEAEVGGVGSAENTELEGIPETLDPSELAKISESMEQWTSQGVPGGVGAENEGLGHGVPTSLMGEEIDVEVDGDSGRPFVVTWIEDIDTRSPKLVRPHSNVPFSLLSVPLPLSSPALSTSIVIKHDVDGLVFAPPSSSPPPTYIWTHTSTFPALAFVLATKRDANFVHHFSDKAVFAFDSPTSTAIKGGLMNDDDGGRSGGGNLFVYFHGGEKEKTARQSVLRVGGPRSGSLMGVGGTWREGRMVLLALCERELVVFNLVF